MFQCSHLDAQGNAVFAEQLRDVRARSYDVRFPELKARRLIPVNNETNPGATTVRVTSYSSVGAVKLISAYADDLPRSDITAETTDFPVRSIGGSYGYNIDEIAASVYGGLGLDAKKAASARRSYEMEVDRLAALGDSKSNLKGLLNQSNAIAYTIPNGAAGTATWATKTGAEILDDMVGMFLTIETTTKGVESADTMLMPLEQYALIQTTPYSSDTELTVLEYFNRTMPGKTIEPWFRCDGAGTGGADRLVVYRRDPNYLELNIPKEWTELSPQERNLEVVVPCHARFGGVNVFYPLSMSYGDGV